MFQLPRKAHPMQFKDQPDVKTCNEKVDVWAMGVLCYELIFGKAPFAAKSPVGTVNSIMRGFQGHQHTVRLHLFELRVTGMVDWLGRADWPRSCCAEAPLSAQDNQYVSPS
jgi:serine/threonine protein kinase